MQGSHSVQPVASWNSKSGGGCPRVAVSSLGRTLSLRARRGGQLSLRDQLTTLTYVVGLPQALGVVTTPLPSGRNEKASCRL